MNRTLLLLVTLFVILSGCSDQPGFKSHEVLRVRSPAGWCEAIVYEFYETEKSQNTQVILSFDDGQGGSGAVSFERIGLQLQIHWLDAENLEIRHPTGVAFSRNPSGERIQFKNRFVNVNLVPFSKEGGT